MLSPLVSADDLATYADVDPLSAKTGQAVRFASSMVRIAAGQTLSYVANDAVTLTGGHPKLLLPEYPVVGVSAVAGKYYATTADPFYYEIYDAAALYGPIPAGVWVQDAQGRLLLPKGACWPPVVTVTYSHGYTVIPDDLQMVVVGLAARMLDNPLADQGKTTGGVSNSIAPTDMTILEDMVIARYRRMTNS